LEESNYDSVNSFLVLLNRYNIVIKKTNAETPLINRRESSNMLYKKNNVENEIERYLFSFPK